MKGKLSGIILALVIIAGGFIVAGALSRSKEMPKRKSGAEKHKPYNFTTVKAQDIAPVVTSGGMLQAFHKIALFAEVSGILHEAETPFRAGNRFKKGAVLLQIDDRVYRNNVLAQKSSLLNQITLFLPDFAIDFPHKAEKWQRYLDNFKLEQNLKPLPEAQDAKEQYFVASRNIYNIYYAARSMEETLAKYTIRAAFDGVVTEAAITPGTLVRMGQKLGEFTNTNLYEVEIPLSLSDLPFVRPGDRVHLVSDNLTGSFAGKVSRINGKIDPSSQTVKVFIQTSDSRLRDGMYLTARIQSSKTISAMRLPARWLVGADQLYVKSDSALVLTKIEIVRNEGESVIIKGLKDGTQILAQELASSARVIKLN